MAALPPSAKPPASDDWPAQAADTIVNVVGQVRDRTTGTAIKASRAVVYGLLAGLLGLTAAVLGLILLDRALVVGVQEVLSLAHAKRAGRATWIVDLLLALLLALGGAFMLKKATSTPAD